METKTYQRPESWRNRISKALKGKPHYWGRKPKIEKVCPCGNKFYLTPGQVRKGHGRFCSRKCTYKYQYHPNFIEMAKKKGKDNVNWKGDKAGYKAFHLRVNNIRGKAKICENCGSKEFVDWASISKKYEDIMDYKALCRKCHNKYDNVCQKIWATRRRNGGDVLA